MGLMFDWTGGWTRKPAYWVYTNFYGNFPGKELVSVAADAGLDALAARSTAGGSAEFALWISNWSGTALPDHGFSIQNYPAAEATVLVLDNLSGPSPVDAIAASGSPLSFSYSIPSNSSLTFVIASEAPSTPAVGPTGIAAVFLLLLAPALFLLVRGEGRRRF
jgi:hypothetical protein